MRKNLFMNNLNKSVYSLIPVNSSKGLSQFQLWRPKIIYYSSKTGHVRVPARPKYRKSGTFLKY